jgi:hypothetical protein
MEQKEGVAQLGLHHHVEVQEKEGSPAQKIGTIGIAMLLL